MNQSLYFRGSCRGLGLPLHLRSLRVKAIALLLSICCVATFTACRNEKTMKIGVSQCSDDDWRQKMNGEIYREMMFHPEATVEIRSAGDNSDRQISDVEYFINNEFDIIVVAPNEAEALTPVIHKAMAAGIPVVIFDRNITDNDYTAFQGADNFGIGREAAQHALTRIDTSDGHAIVEIRGLEGSTPAIGRHNGFFSRIASQIDTTTIARIDGKWTYDDTYPAIYSYLSQNPQTQLVYAHNDRMAIAASDAARELGIRPYIIGIDAAPEIGMKAVNDGVIDATFLYPTEGAQLINTALAILNSKPYEKEMLIPSSSAVTKDNVGVLLAQNEELKQENRHLEQLKTQLDDYWQEHTAQNTLLVAAIIIIILAFIVIFSVLKAVWTHKRHRKELARQNERLENQKQELLELNNQLNEATQSKLTFFTNVSHDLRTPLTLIAEPVAHLARATNLTSAQHTMALLADKNVRILKRLINQILDFRKYENGKLKLNLTETNVGLNVEEWVASFASLARHRHITLATHIDRSENMVMAVDAEKLERIVFNIVSNALKFTPDNGNIEVGCHVADGKLVIRIADNGRGIPAADIDHIFQSFYQADKVHPTGSGIGLSVVKAFVELHNGTITVESSEGKGTTFTVIIPVCHADNTSARVTPLITSADIDAELNTIAITEESFDDTKPRLLIIDDNEDICTLVSQLLNADYNVITAGNGRQGLKMATKYTPDVIICDIMMPVMDGLECCRLLKSEIATSHIPVLMLTACSLDEQRVQGLDSGADGYLAKPFNNEVLKAQVRNLINNRKLIRNIYSGFDAPASSAIPEQPAATVHKPASGSKQGIDSDFYNKFVQLVEQNMHNPDLNVEAIAADMGLARSQFYRKIKALTNFSPVELLRGFRLKKARTLLTSTEMSISEIGYEVGFSSAAYFTKCYRDEFGETPTQLRERLGH